MEGSVVFDLDYTLLITLDKISISIDRASIEYLSKCSSRSNEYRSRIHITYFIELLQYNSILYTWATYYKNFLHYIVTKYYQSKVWGFWILCPEISNLDFTSWSYIPFALAFLLFIFSVKCYIYLPWMFSLSSKIMPHIFHCVTSFSLCHVVLFY